eukprot:1159410-Pelagomonas_calceolata.AAC.5
MLVVDTVVPGSVTDGKLEPGDVLWMIESDGKKWLEVMIEMNDCKRLEEQGQVRRDEIVMFEESSSCAAEKEHWELLLLLYCVVFATHNPDARGPFLSDLCLLLFFIVAFIVVVVVDIMAPFYAAHSRPHTYTYTHVRFDTCTQLTVRIPVTDLHSVTPSSFLEVSGGTVHALSYQQARNNRAAVGQVYVAEPGYMLVGTHQDGMMAGVVCVCVCHLMAVVVSSAWKTTGRLVPTKQQKGKKLVRMQVVARWCVRMCTCVRGGRTMSRVFTRQQDCSRRGSAS